MYKSVHSSMSLWKFSPIPTICSGIHCIEPSFYFTNTFQTTSKYDVVVQRVSTVFPWVRSTHQVGRLGCLNEWFLITTWKQSVWSTRIGRITLIWNPLLNSRVRSYESPDSVVANIESPQCCHTPGPSVLGAPDPRRTETFTRQVSTSRLPEPTPLTKVYYQAFFWKYSIKKKKTV